MASSSRAQIPVPPTMTSLFRSAPKPSWNHYISRSQVWSCDDEIFQFHQHYSWSSRPQIVVIPTNWGPQTGPLWPPLWAPLWPPQTGPLTGPLFYTNKEEFEATKIAPQVLVQTGPLFYSNNERQTDQLKGMFEWQKSWIEKTKL